MMPTSKILSVLALLLCAQTSLSYAQNTSASPPKLEPIDDINDTPITVTAKPAQKNEVLEHKEQGRVTEVKVTSGPSTYYLKPNNNDSGIAGRNTSGPQWRVMEFGGKKKTTHEDEADAAPVPPPPSLPPSAQTQPAN